MNSIPLRPERSLPEGTAPEAPVVTGNDCEAMVRSLRATGADLLEGLSLVRTAFPETALDEDPAVLAWSHQEILRSAKLKDGTGMSMVSILLEKLFAFDPGLAQRALGTAEGMEVNGDLLLIGNRNLRELPDGLRVLGEVRLQDCTLLSSTPTGLQVQDGVKLTNCISMKNIAPDSRIEGYLNVMGCLSWDGNLPEGVSGDALLFTEAYPMGASVKRWRERQDATTPILHVLKATGASALEALQTLQHIHKLWAPSSIPGMIEWIQQELREAAQKHFMPSEGSEAGPFLKRLFQLDGILANKVLEGMTDLEAHGHLSLSECADLKALPRGLKVGGFLDLRGCRNLRDLPEGLSVTHGVNLKGCTAWERGGVDSDDPPRLPKKAAIPENAMIFTDDFFNGIPYGSFKKQVERDGA